MKTEIVSSLQPRVGLVLCLLSFGQSLALPALADATSRPAILQMYEARWNTIENRMADIFRVGYGQMWLPPPTRAGPCGSNVGYEVFDRFDLGRPGNNTLYGTEAGLKTAIAAGHAAGLKMYTDLVPNHNGFRNLNTPSFLEQGGYNGFALTLPNDPFGDFHDVSIPVDQDPLNGSLLGLLDIAQEKRYTFIRQPVSASDPNNIPPGTVNNWPAPNNARFYPDQDLGEETFNDPTLGTQVTRYRFNATSPHDGDPVMETAMQLLMRNVQWMVEVIGVDGFRVDAAKHMPAGVHLNLDQAAFRANSRLQLDGDVGNDGYEVWRFAFGFQRTALTSRSTETASAVPEPDQWFMLVLSLAAGYAASSSSDLVRQGNRSRKSGAENRE